MRLLSAIRRALGMERKLSDDQIKELHRLKQENDYSCSALAAIAISRDWCDSMNLHTIENYMKLVEEGDL